VCQHNADLACLDVAIHARTPQYTHNGHTYYFCSEACRADFEREPSTYVER